MKSLDYAMFLASIFNFSMYRYAEEIDWLDYLAVLEKWLGCRDSPACRHL